MLGTVPFVVVIVVVVVVVVVVVGVVGVVTGLGVSIDLAVGSLFFGCVSSWRGGSSFSVRVSS